MHDRRREIEARLTRALDERLRLAIHTTVAPLTVEVWHVPPTGDGHVGEPVPFEMARDAAYEPARSESPGARRGARRGSG
jgi:alpha-mannosidase